MLPGIASDCIILYWYVYLFFDLAMFSHYCILCMNEGLKKPSSNHLFLMMH